MHITKSHVHCNLVLTFFTIFVVCRVHVHYIHVSFTVISSQLKCGDNNSEIYGVFDYFVNYATFNCVQLRKFCKSVPSSCSIRLSSWLKKKKMEIGLMCKSIDYGGGNPFLLSLWKV